MCLNKNAKGQPSWAVGESERRTETRHSNVINQFDELHDWRSICVISNDRLAKRGTGTQSEWGEVLGIVSHCKKWWIGRRGPAAHPSTVASSLVRRFVQGEIIRRSPRLYKQKSQCRGSVMALSLTASRIKVTVQVNRSFCNTTENRLERSHGRTMAI
jgi:hypothetical protein